MDILINPDVVYLLLVVGFMMAVMALVVPGTGVLELVAFAILGVAGYGVSQLNFNWVALVVLFLALVPFFFSLRKVKPTLMLVLTVVALTLGSTFLFVDESWRPIVNPVLAVVVILLQVGFFWIVVRKSLEAIHTRPSHSLATLEGAIGETRTEVFREGSVYVRGELWSAVSSVPIPARTRVKVLNRSGLILEVEVVKPA